MKTKLPARVITILTMTFSIISLISIGFSSWTMSLTDDESFILPIDADSVNFNLQGVNVTVDSVFSISNYFFDNGNGDVSENGYLIYSLNVDQSNLDSSFIFSNKLVVDGSICLEPSASFTEGFEKAELGTYSGGSYSYNTVSCNTSSSSIVFFPLSMPVTIGGGTITYKLKFTFNRYLCDNYASILNGSKFVLRLEGVSSV